MPKTCDQASTPSSCSSNSNTENKASSCCPSTAAQATSTSCCDTDEKAQTDWLLWGSASVIATCYSLYVLFGHDANSPLPAWLATMSHGVFELINTMWWGVALAAVFVGLLNRIPQAMVTAVLGQGGSLAGVVRATAAGVALDLCSHGILMVGMQLYQRGASIGQVMAFLIASPWNSLSLTLILVSLIGLKWTAVFIITSMLIAVTTGWLFDLLVRRQVLPANPSAEELPQDYALWPAIKAQLATSELSARKLVAVLMDGIKASRMVLRWLFFGVVLATALRSFIGLDDFQQWFGPTALGLAITLVAATIIEVCSEGSTPIAADILTRANAPGNSFAFLMTGVATDYTEIMVVKDTTRSWHIALMLPLLTVPQVVALAVVMNAVPL